MLTHPLPDGRIPALLSAHDPELIRQDAAAILDYLDRAAGPADAQVIGALAATLLRLRRIRRHRAVVRATDRAELAAGLSALTRGEEHPLITRSARTATPRVAFVFPGQGNQWPAMGADAYQRLPFYRETADQCAEAFVAAALPSPLPCLVGELGQTWSRTQIQGAQFTHAVSLAAAWRASGVLPDITIGHSLGEVAAAYVAATIALPDAVALVGARAGVVDRLTGRYAMAVLGLGADDAESVLADAPGWLEVSAVNGPASTVVSGDHEAVAAAVQSARERGVFAHQLSVDYPGHTSALRPLCTNLAEQIPKSSFSDGPVRFIGSTIGAEVGDDVDFSDYWCENLCCTVRFDLAVRYARTRGADTFVEMSAHPSLLYPLADLIDDESAVIVGSGHRERCITDSLSASIAAVATADPGCRWDSALPGAVPLGARTPLRGFPNAPMRAVHLWAAPEPPTDTVPLAPADTVPLAPADTAPLAPADIALTVAVEHWQEAVSPRTPSPMGRAIGFVSAAVEEFGLTHRLIDAVAVHAGCRAVPPNEAEIIAVIAPRLDRLDAIAAIGQIADRRDAGLPDYAAIIGPRCRAVWLLTTGAELVNGNDTEVLPAQAALAAMHRSVGFEYPDQTFGHLDLPRTDFDARAVVDVLLGDAAEVALRDTGSPRRYVRTFRDCRASAITRPLDGAALEHVVITGGSGAIGLQYARYSVERGARAVTLLSRNGVDPSVLRQLTENHEVEVHAPRCDITDRAALSTVAADYAGSGASLVIHAAGVARAHRRSELTGTEVAAVCAAKVRGLALLAEVWPLRPECRILACSSVFGVWGGHGHAAYAASNRMLDVLATQLRAEGRECTALRWGLWRGAGVVGADEITRTERSGLVAMDPKLALDAGMCRYDGDPLIFDADFDRLAVFFESQGMPAPFRPPVGGNSVAEGDDSAARPLAEVVRDELAATLHLVDSVSIDPSASLIDLGVDSLLALDLRKRLRRTVGSSVPVARMLGGITVHELIDALRSTSGPVAFERTAAGDRAQPNPGDLGRVGLLA